MPLDPNTIAQEWSQRLASSTQKIQAGVQNVTVAPGQAAARQKQVYLQNVQAAADKWARNVASVTLADWQNAMINKGVQRVASGAQAAQDKFAAFMGRLIPHIEAGRRQLPARGNLDQNIARMTAWVRHMANFGRTGTGSGM